MLEGDDPRCGNCGIPFNPKLKFLPYSGFGYNRLCQICWDKLNSATNEAEEDNDEETDDGESEVSTATPIRKHEGSKYLRKIYAPPGGYFGVLGNGRGYVEADVYAVLDAFGVTCNATGHAIKKLLCAGLRGKGDRMADLRGALAALNRAIELEQDREENDDAG